MKPISEREQATPYDEFLGRFVDAVQSSQLSYARLQAEWLRACRPDWHDRFQVDVAEIESLVDAGAFLTSDAA